MPRCHLELLSKSLPGTQVTSEAGVGGVVTVLGSLSNDGAAPPTERGKRADVRASEKSGEKLWDEVESVTTVRKSWTEWVVTPDR